MQSKHVLVTSDQQTVVVTAGVNIRLDWSRWVMETLGESASNATYVFHRTQLNESGSAIGTTEELTPSQLPERIFVNVGREVNEFYVEITCVVVADQSDSDRAIYDLEACRPQPGGNEACFNSNITVYAIERPQPLRKPIIICYLDHMQKFGGEGGLVHTHTSNIAGIKQRQTDCL